MRMMNELKHLFLYPASSKVYVPINDKDRKRGSAILLLTKKLETSLSLTTLPYIHNPNLYNSFYMNRNAMTYINPSQVEEFDEVEQEQLSESLFNHKIKKVKFKFSEDVSIIDKRNIEVVFNTNKAMDYVKQLGLKNFPETIEINVYPIASMIKLNANPSVLADNPDGLYGYSEGNKCHLVSKSSYDISLNGQYNEYLSNQLLYLLIRHENKEINHFNAKAISYAINNSIDHVKYGGEERILKFAKIINKTSKLYGVTFIKDFIRTNDINTILTANTRYRIKDIVSGITESELSYSERQSLPDYDFGIPSKRKFPIHDEDHVRQAIRMFNTCDRDEEEELARNINKRIKKFGMEDIKVSASNQFKKYYEPPKTEDKEQKEKKKFKFGNKNESFVHSDYEDILKICNDLDNNELSRISFYDTYRDSKFVIKRIIHRQGPDPAGFLDVYQYPSCPDIAQITIAVAKRFRGRGIAKDMVEELMKSNLEDSHNFKVYYWTAHTDNDISIHLASSFGFIDTNTIDKYGRKVFVKYIEKDINPVSEARKSLDSNSIESEILKETSILCELTDREYNLKLKNYLYNQRLMRDKDVLPIYTRVKELAPNIKNTYPRIKLYRSFNLFVDLSYYHGIFLNNNTMKLDRGIDLYLEFLSRLLNDKNLKDAGYTNQVIFVPVDKGVWDEPKDSDICDFKTTLNPISAICRVIRTNPTLLKEKFGNKKFIFVSGSGYFTIDFNQFNIKEIQRFKTNINKLRSNEKIEDDYEIDSLEVDNLGNEKSKDSSAAITANIIDTIEKKTSIKIDSVKPNIKSNKKMVHLSLNTNNIITTNQSRVAAIIIQNDKFKEDEQPKGIIHKIPHLSIYCRPN